MIRKALFAVWVILFLSGHDTLLAVTTRRSIAPRIEASVRTGQSYKISFEEMESQMTELARRAKVEDQWLYVIEDGTLYDVGKDNDAHSVGVDFSKLESGEINIRGKRIVDIHIHAWEGHSSRDFLPTSTPDLHYNAGHGKPEYSRFGAIEIRKIVYDGHGVWEATTSVDFDKKVAPCGDSRLLDRVNDFKEKIRGESIEERAGVIKRYIAKCKTVGLEMTYKSLE